MSKTPISKNQTVVDGIDTDDTVQVPTRTREEAAEMVLRSMVADMRQQGWTLSNDQADEMVASIREEIL